MAKHPKMTNETNLKSLSMYSEIIAHISSYMDNHILRKFLISRHFSILCFIITRCVEMWCFKIYSSALLLVCVFVPLL